MKSGCIRVEISLDEALGMSLADEADESIHVDIDTRQIIIPESQKLFGVESDADVEVKHIVIDGRYADGNRDLSKLAWRVVYRNAKKGSGYYLIPSVVANKNSIEMDWLIKRSVVAYEGTVDFILCAFATTSSGEVTPEWNSTLGQGIVLKGLETSAIDIGKESVDELSKILYETVTAKDVAVSAASNATANAENAAGSAVSAGNSASAAARSEQAAGASEEQAAKASEQAAESAQAALESKTAAATSEVNAAASAKKAQDVADSLPADYTTAVNEIAALKTNKADKTELDSVEQQVKNITPDDSSIGEKPWSSKHIIDMLCPPLEESGNPVVCYPVAGYPLDVKAKWEPVQEGSGTPSPENIRPIKGRDSVKVERCGENLLDSVPELPIRIYKGSPNVVVRSVPLPAGQYTMKVRLDAIPGDEAITNALIKYEMADGTEKYFVPKASNETSTTTAFETAIKAITVVNYGSIDGNITGISLVPGAASGDFKRYIGQTTPPDPARNRVWR